MHKREVKERIRSWAVLVIDEASMLSAEFFEQVRLEGEGGGVLLAKQPPRPACW
jgi:hypothetical protein